MNMNHLSRRRLLQLSASTLLTANLWPGRLWAADRPAEAFEFIVINDLHAIDEADGKWCEKVVASMKALEAKPEICFIAGDLTENGTAKEFAVVLDVFKTLGMPIYTTPGNHDYLPKSTDRKAYEAALPDRVDYSFEHKGWQFVSFDSTDGVKAQVSVLKPALDYLDATLPKLDKSRPTIVVTHFPLGPKVPNRAKNADEVLDRFKGHNLAGVFGGHHHGLTETEVRGIPIKTNRCCSLTKGNHDKSKEKGYFLCSAKEGKVTAKFVEFKAA